MLIALNANYEVVKRLTTIYNLMWTRRYYEAGQFQAALMASEYTDEMKYVYNPTDGQLAEIERIEYTSTENKETLVLSGYFIEKRLIDYVIYPKFNMTGKTETIVKKLITDYAKIETAQDLSRGNEITKDIIGTALDLAVIDILQEQEYGYRITYDFLTNKQVFDIWQGLDRTDDQVLNTQCVFSETNKNIKNIKVTKDSSNYKNVCIVDNNGTYTEVDISKEGEAKKYIFTTAYLEDTNTEAATQYGKEFLLGYENIENIEAQYQQTRGYTYRQDFDLGDKVTIVISGLEYTARIIEINEIYKTNEVIIELTFGNKIKTIKDQIKEVNK